MAIDFNKRKTCIIPVTKHDDEYVLKVADVFWNELQVLILKGADKENLTIEFQIIGETKTVDDFAREVLLNGTHE